MYPPTDLCVEVLAPHDDHVLDPARVVHAVVDQKGHVPRAQVLARAVPVCVVLVCPEVISW